MKTLNKILLILLLVSCTKKEPAPKYVDNRVTVAVHYSMWCTYKGLQFYEPGRTYNLTKGYKLNLTIEKKDKYIIFDGHDSLLINGKTYDIDTLFIQIYANGKKIYKGKGDNQQVNAEL
jgi:hypothetical protein